MNKKIVDSNISISFLQKWTFLLLFSCFFSLSFAQADSLVATGTPYQSVRTHLQYLQPKNYHPKQAAKVLQSKGYTQKELEDLAEKLIQIYNGSGYYINLKKIPNDSAYYDSTLKQPRYVVCPDYPEIYIEKIKGKWLYSSKSLQEIPRIHKELYPLGLDKWVEFMAAKGQDTFWGIYIWQLLGFLGLMVASFVLFKLMDWIFGWIIHRISSRKSRYVPADAVKPVARPLSLWVLMLILQLLIPVLQFPIWINTILMYILRISEPVFLVMTAYHFIDFVAAVAQGFADDTESNLDNQLLPLFRRSLKIAVYVLGGIYILKSIHVDITTLLAGISISGLAFALAAQDTVKNFIGSITILVDKPFHTGDYIEIDNKTGIVEEIGVRSTRIRQFDNALITIPNAKIMDNAVYNGGARTFRKFQPKLTVEVQSMEILRAFIEEIKQYVDAHPLTHNEGNQIYLSNLNGKNVEIFVSILFDAAKQKEAEVRQQVISGILDAAQKHGVKLG